MLLLLVENRNQILEKSELLEHLWPGSIVEEANLSQTVYLLRRALAEGVEGQSYIETVPRRGYRFIAAVSEINAENVEFGEQSENGFKLADTSPMESEIADEQPGISQLGKVAPTVPRWWRRPGVYGIAVIVLGVLIFIHHLWSSHYRGKPVTAGPVHSLAVLPFRSLGSDEGDNYLGMGMADVLITRLSNLDQIVVQPISAVRKYDRPEIHPLAAGQELRVDAVLEGTLQKVANRLRVTLRLHDMRNGRTLWSGKFDDDFTDIFKVQDSISEQIAQALALSFTREKRNQAFKRYTENSVAYELYLKGRYWWNRRTVDGLNKAIGYFEQAITQAPDYALAYAGLADSYNLLSILEAMPPHEAFLKARSAATHALEIDDTLAEAHTSLGWIKCVYEWDWEGSEREFKHAIELSPGYAIAHDWYGVCLAQRGQFDRALSELTQAERLDPISFVIQVHIGWVHFYSGQYDQAIERYQKVLEMDPNYAWAHMHLGQAYEQKKMYPESIAELRRALSLSSNAHRYVARLGRLYAVSGQIEEARKLLDELLATQKKRYVSPYSIALVYAGLNEKDRALDWLRIGMEQRAGRMVRLQVDPRFNNLRAEPQFKEILQRINPSQSAGTPALAKNPD